MENRDDSGQSFVCVSLSESPPPQSQIGEMRNVARADLNEIGLSAIIATLQVV